MDETMVYIKEGLGGFCVDDGVPISMKSVLYNRFCHLGWCETPNTFRSWYECIYYTNAKLKTNAPERKRTNYYNPLLISAILGDISGSIYEFNSHKDLNINLQNRHMDYTDDMIMTIAVAD